MKIKAVLFGSVFVALPSFAGIYLADNSDTAPALVYPTPQNLPESVEVTNTPAKVLSVEVVNAPPPNTKPAIKAEIAQKSIPVGVQPMLPRESVPRSKAPSSVATRHLLPPGEKGGVEKVEVVEQLVAPAPGVVSVAPVTVVAPPVAVVESEVVSVPAPEVVQVVRKPAPKVVKVTKPIPKSLPLAAPIEVVAAPLPAALPIAPEPVVVSTAVAVEPVSPVLVQPRVVAPILGAPPLLSPMTPIATVLSPPLICSGIPRTSESMPACVQIESPVYILFPVHTGTVRENVEHMIGQVHWGHIVWNVPYDYNWVGDITIKAVSVEDALTQYLDPYPVQARFYRKNHVVEIVPRRAV